jgi:hypothetical protein
MAIKILKILEFFEKVKYFNIVLHLNKTDCSLPFIVSEWLLFNANSAIFQPYHGKNKLIFNEMMMRSSLY